MRIIKVKLTKQGVIEWGRRALSPFILLCLFMLLIEVYIHWIDLPTRLFVIRRIASNLSLGILLFGPAVFMKRATKSIYLVIVSLLMSIIFAAHYTYAMYAGGFLSMSSLSYLWQLPTVGTSVAALLRPQLLLFLTLPIAAIILSYFERLSIGLPPTTRRSKFFGAAVILVALIIGYGFLFAKEQQTEKTIFRLIYHSFNSDLLMGKVGVVNYSILDAVKFASKKRSISPGEVARAKELAPTYKFQPEGRQYHGALAGKNVIYLQLESFQYFLINKKLDGVELTPNLNKLANGGLNFSNFHYMSGAGTSSDAEFVALNSLVNLGDRATVFEYPTGDYNALPKLLREKGYTAVAMHGDSRNFWNRANTFPGFGYEKFYALEEYTPSEEKIAWGINDEDFFQQSAGYIKGLRQPFFSHVITLSSHTPFHVPERFRTINFEKYNLDWIQENYILATRYTDLALGKFLDEVNASDLSKNTAIVVVADHEPYITNKNDLNFARFLGYESGFDDQTYLQSRQIPFIIYAPGVLEPQTVGTPGSFIDIYPTLTNLLGIPTPASVLGKDVLNTDDSVVVRRKRSSGIDIEMIISKNLTYVGGASSSAFEDGTCYEGGKPIRLEVCQNLFNRQSERIELSDLVLRGNRLDLLR